jgi:hypothetical protein
MADITRRLFFLKSKYKEKEAMGTGHLGRFSKRKKAHRSNRPIFFFAGSKTMRIARVPFFSLRFPYRTKKGTLWLRQHPPSQPQCTFYVVEKKFYAL